MISGASDIAESLCRVPINIHLVLIVFHLKLLHLDESIKLCHLCNHYLSYQKS